MKLALPEPSLFVIFGARGDLARRKLIPALCRVLAPEERRRRIHILGVGTPSDINHEKFRLLARDALREAGVPDGGDVQLVRSLRALPFDRGPERGGLRQARQARSPRSSGSTACRATGVFYLALPPQAFVPTITALGEAGLNRSPGWTRVVVEKPFGRDLASAIELNQAIHQYFDESQVYRIDHYLGKETVQNLLVFRFANAVFESIWNRDRIESVQITVAEDLGVEHRGRYYEGAGALRDMVQNHLTQLLTLIAHGDPVDLRRRGDPDGEDQDPALARPDPAGGRRLRPVRRRDRSAAQRCRPTGDEPDVAPDSHDRDLRRPAPGGRQLALVRRAVLPADRKAPAAPGDPDRRALPPPAGLHLQGPPRAARSPPTSWSSRSSRTRASTSASR